MVRILMRGCLRHICKLLLVFVLGVGMASVSARAENEKNIAALVYDFPPYFELEDDGTYSGIGIELLKVMSELSPDYEFEIVSASPRRRHDIFKNKKVDVSLFDQISWGWQDMDVDHTDVYMHGGERYIATKRMGASSSKIFENLEQKRLVGILGYHYNFAGYKSDPNYLHEHFNIELVAKQDQIIKMVQSNRADIGIVTEAYFLSYLVRRPSLRVAFEVSDFYDQEYNFVGIRSAKSEIPLNELNKLILDGVASKTYKSILVANGLGE